MNKEQLRRVKDAEGKKKQTSPNPHQPHAARHKRSDSFHSKQRRKKEGRVFPRLPGRRHNDETIKESIAQHHIINEQQQQNEHTTRMGDTQVRCREEEQGLELIGSYYARMLMVTEKLVSDAKVKQEEVLKRCKECAAQETLEKIRRPR